VKTRDPHNPDHEDDQQRYWRLRERLEIFKLISWMIFEAIKDMIGQGGPGSWVLK
jgi:hypothetical protein